MFVMALLETASIASIVPFIAVMTNPDLILKNDYLIILSKLINSETTEEFIIILGLIVLFVIVLGNLFSAYVTRKILLFSNLQGHELSKKLFIKYLYQPYEFYLSRNSSELSKNMLSEVGRVVVGVLSPAMILISKLVVIVFISVLLFATNPKITFLVFFVIGGTYSLIFFYISRKIAKLGERTVFFGEKKYQFANEAFSGIKELKVLGREDEFVNRYSKVSIELANHNATSQILVQLPRYLLEIIAFGGVLLIALYYISSKGLTNSALPYIALFTFSGYRLMPSFQQVFNSLGMIRYNKAALELICRDLNNREIIRSYNNYDRISQDLVPIKNLFLDNITFKYKGSSKPILENFALNIIPNSTIGIVGTTGSGKTTVLDILLGLLTPVRGSLIVNDIEINEQNHFQWQAIIGYVPQSIFLVDDTIKNNIALGQAGDEIDEEKVIKVARMAMINEFIMNELPQGYNTNVGERGVKLSGGQKQRIGIARALYHDPKVLVLDEATSALDAETEKNIMKSIFSLSEQKTIIIVTHRISTIENCDVIHFLEGGEIIDSGRYNELLNKCASFNKLVNTLPAKKA